MSKIKLLVMDVDGTLTDGCIYVSAQGECMKAFNVKDGYGIAQILPKIDILPIIITGRKSEIVEKRATELNIVHCYQGISDKLSLLMSIAEDMKVSPEEIAYIGDDLNDMACIDFCGLTACPADSILSVREKVDFVCHADGGRGAVREFIDYLSNT